MIHEDTTNREIYGICLTVVQKDIPQSYILSEKSFFYEHVNFKFIDTFNYALTIFIFKNSKEIHREMAFLKNPFSILFML